MAAVAPAGPLVTTEWLGRQPHADDLRVADCRFYLPEPDRGRHEFEMGHIPGSCYFSLDDELTAAEGPGRHPLPDAGFFADTIRRRGIGSRHIVVVYDQGDHSMAPRLWWMLRSLGHRHVYVLDGGWAAWIDEKRSTTTEVPEWEPESAAIGEGWSGIVDREAIEVADPGDLLLVDSRAAARHRGEIEPIDPVAGHIPGSINIPYQGNTSDRGRFLTGSELRERFAAVGESDRVVCYCGSGVTACNNILAMEIAGRTGVLLYPGSWSDWCTSGGAIATHE